MLLEVCVYRCEAGRLPALLKRFEHATLGFFARHGFRPHGFFTTLVGQSHQEVTYMLLWQSMAEREKAWAAFHADPEWHEARIASEREAGGPLVLNASNQILKPTAFSPLQ